MSTTKRSKRRIESVIMDWSGTLNDEFGIVATNGFVDAFRIHGLPLTCAEARRPMGLGKDEHTRRLLPRDWKSKSCPTKDPLEQIDAENALVKRIGETYASIVQRKVADPKTCPLIPGALCTVLRLMDQGVMPGVTTGYPRAIAQAAVVSAQQQGFGGFLIPNAASDDIGITQGRPSSMMLWRVLEQQLGMSNTPMDFLPRYTFNSWKVANLCSLSLRDTATRLLRHYRLLVDNHGNAHHLSKVLNSMRAELGPRIVKVGDTENDMGEAYDAGAWSVAVVGTSSYIGVESKSAWEQMTPQSRNLHVNLAEARFTDECAAFKPDYIIDSVAQLPQVVCDINDRLGDQLIAPCIPNALRERRSARTTTSLLVPWC
jgi:phosphoglycolate phosphatase-like HAD superfamily hydrolase